MANERDLNACSRSMTQIFRKMNLRSASQQGTSLTFVGDLEVDNARHLLFASSTGYHIRGRRVDATYLEEDGTYIPMLCLKEEILIHRSRVLSGYKVLTPQRNHVFTTLAGEKKLYWETRDINNCVCLALADPITNRPDTPQITRSQKLEDAISYNLPPGFRILNMPILVGEMDIVLTMPLSLSPKLGARRELPRLIPGLIEHLSQYALKLGQVVEVYLSLLGAKRRVYIIMDRHSDRDLGDIQAWVAGMMLILEQAENAELRQLVLLRPPDHYLLPGWHEIATLLDSLRIDAKTPEIVLAPGTFSNDPRYNNPEPILISQTKQPGIRLTRLEQPLAPIMTIYDVPSNFDYKIPRCVKSTGMVRTLYTKTSPIGTIVRSVKSCLVLSVLFCPLLNCLRLTW